MHIAKLYCHLLIWEKGLKFAEKMCNEKFMSVELTGLIGRPITVNRKHFDIGYSENADSIEWSRFATFEINLDLNISDDEDIFID